MSEFFFACLRLYVSLLPAGACCVKAKSVTWHWLNAQTTRSCVSVSFAFVIVVVCVKVYTEGSHFHVSNVANVSLFSVWLSCYSFFFCCFVVAQAVLKFCNLGNQLLSLLCKMLICWYLSKLFDFSFHFVDSYKYQFGVVVRILEYFLGVYFFITYKTPIQIHTQYILIISQVVISLANRWKGAMVILLYSFPFNASTFK